ncbi:MAG: hypothetical protein RID07_13740 [Lacipirellulaceae bacterium]
MAKKMLAAVFVLCALTETARSEDDGWLEFEEEGAVAQNHFEVSPEQFEQWVFQHQGSASKQRKKLELELQLTIEEISRSCELNESQEEKLRLAGEADIRSFFYEYHVVREKFMKVRHDQQEFNKIWNDIQPLQQKLGAGLFNQGSMLKKVADSTLNKEQGKERRQADAARRKFRYQALVELHVMNLEKQVPLKEKERKALLKLILTETHPPTVFGQSDQIYLIYHLSQISKEKVTAAVPGAQGRALLKMYQQGRHYKNHLKQQGVEPFVQEEEDEDVVGKALREAQIDKAIKKFLGDGAPADLQLEVDDPFGQIDDDDFEALVRLIEEEAGEEVVEVKGEVIEGKLILPVGENLNLIIDP